jgi:hypothetical protein
MSILANIFLFIHYSEWFEVLYYCRFFDFTLEYVIN